MAILFYNHKITIYNWAYIGHILQKHKIPRIATLYRDFVQHRNMYHTHYIDEPILQKPGPVLQKRKIARIAYLYGDSV